MNKKDLLNAYITKFRDGLNDFHYDTQIDSNMYDEAVKRAYRDAQRVFKNVDTNKITNPIKALSKRIRAYFENDKEQFSHEAFCKCFQDSFKKGYMSYGGAQKVVNLAFKYLYCFDEFRNVYDNKFQKCHMTIDSFILDWLYQDKQLRNFSKVKATDKWSSLSKKKYMLIQNTVASFLELKKSLFNAFEFEFILWPNLILYSSLIDFLHTVDNKLDKRHLRQKYRLKDIDQLLKKTGTAISNYGFDGKNIFEELE